MKTRILPSTTLLSILAASAVILTTGFTGSLHAQTIITWDFNTVPRDAASVTGDATSLVVGNNATLGSGLTGTTSGNPNGGFSSGTNSTFYLTAATTNSEAGAVTDNDYIQFSFNLTPTAISNGYTFNVNSLGFQVGANSSASVTFTATQFLRSGVDAYSNTLLTGSYNHSGTTLGFASPVSANLGSNSSYEGLTSLTFRIYAYSNVNRLDAWGRGDNVIANISVIPEPSSAILLSLGVIGLLMARRARRS